MIDANAAPLPPPIAHAIDCPLRAKDRTFIGGRFLALRDCRCTIYETKRAKGSCAYCEAPLNGSPFGLAPEGLEPVLPLCRACGMGYRPTLMDLRRKLGLEPAQEVRP